MNTKSVRLPTPIPIECRLAALDTKIERFSLLLFKAGSIKKSTVRPQPRFSLDFRRSAGLGFALFVARAGEFSLATNAMCIDERLYVGGNESGDSSNLDVRDLAIRRLVI